MRITQPMVAAGEFTPFTLERWCHVSIDTGFYRTNDWDIFICGVNEKPKPLRPHLIVDIKHEIVEIQRVTADLELLYPDKLNFGEWTYITGTQEDERMAYLYNKSG